MHNYYVDRKAALIWFWCGTLSQIIWHTYVTVLSQTEALVLLSQWMICCLATLLHSFLFIKFLYMLPLGFWCGFWKIFPLLICFAVWTQVDFVLFYKKLNLLKKYKKQGWYDTDSSSTFIVLQTQDVYPQQINFSHMDFLLDSFVLHVVSNS